MKTSRRLVGSSTGDAEMMCGEQQSASAALFTCGQQGEGARCCRAHKHTTMGTKFEISTTFVSWEWRETRRKNLSHPHSRLRLLRVHLIYILPQLGSWLLTGVSGSRVQADMSPVAAQMLRTLAHHFRQCHNVRVSAVTNNFKQECNTRS